MARWAAVICPATAAIVSRGNTATQTAPSSFGLTGRQLSARGAQAAVLPEYQLSHSVGCPRLVFTLTLRLHVGLRLPESRSRA